VFAVFLAGTDLLAGARGQLGGAGVTRRWR
jgi:hypothetical protein